MNQETEKITKEQLLQELKMKNLNDEELEKIAGGAVNRACYQQCRETGKSEQYCNDLCEGSRFI